MVVSMYLLPAISVFTLTAVFIIIEVVVANFNVKKENQSMPKTTEKKVKEKPAPKRSPKSKVEPQRSSYEMGLDHLPHIIHSAYKIRKMQVPNFDHANFCKTIEQLSQNVQDMKNMLDGDTSIADNAVRQVFTVYLAHLRTSLASYTDSVKINISEKTTDVGKEIFTIAESIVRILADYKIAKSRSDLMTSSSHNALIKEMLNKQGIVVDSEKVLEKQNA